MSKKKKKKHKSNRVNKNYNLYKTPEWILEETKKKIENDDIIFQTKNIIIREKPIYKKKANNKRVIFLTVFSLFIFVFLIGGISLFENKILKSQNNTQNIKTNIKEEKSIKKIDKEKQIINKINKSSNVEKIDNPIEKMPILTFHRLVTTEVKENKFPHGEWANDISVFEQEMEYLYKNGYKTLSMDELYCWYIKKCEYPQKTVVITFDDGDYDIYYLGLPILKKYNFKATMFTIGSYIAQKTYEYDQYERHYIGNDLINRVKRDYPNLEFQSHTYNMHHLDSNGRETLLNKTYKELEEDYINNDKYGFNYIAYPYGIYNTNMEKLAKKYNYLLGFRFRNSDYTTRNSDQYALPRIKINSYMTVEDMAKWLNN